MERDTKNPKKKKFISNRGLNLRPQTLKIPKKLIRRRGSNSDTRFLKTPNPFPIEPPGLMFRPTKSDFLIRKQKNALLTLSYLKNFLKFPYPNSIMSFSASFFSSNSFLISIHRYAFLIPILFFVTVLYLHIHTKLKLIMHSLCVYMT